MVRRLKEALQDLPEELKLTTSLSSFESLIWILQTLLFRFLVHFIIIPQIMGLLAQIDQIICVK